MLTDAFGQRVQMSLDQFRDLLDQACSGSLDDVIRMEEAPLG
ncbi:hypothetical protein [Nocardiopsis sp. SBT366]|nr:hypothetical protein [Nocardiopsis sp. SBT366]